MAVIWQSATTNSAGSSNSLVINKPTSTASGDLLIAHISVSTVASGSAPPSGWTLIDGGTSSMMGVWWKIAGGSEPTTYTFTSSSTPNMLGAIHRFTGTSPMQPINVSGYVVTTGGTQTLTITGGILPTAANSLMLGLTSWNVTGGAFTSFALANNNPTWVNAASITGTNGLYGQTGTYAPATTTGNATVTMTGGTPINANFAFCLIAIAVLPVQTIITSTFSVLTPVTVISFIASIITSTFHILAATITDSSKWTRQQKSSSASWTTQNKETT